MKLKFNVLGKTQPDPFIFQDGDTYYLYVTGNEGVRAYSTKDIFGVWNFEGLLAQTEGAHNFWAPCVIKIGGVYYMYVSFDDENIHQYMHVAKSNSPLGPFRDEKMLYERFSIDSHIVETESGLYLFFAQNVIKEGRQGTRVFVDKLIDPYTVEDDPKELIEPTFDEEINKNSLKWHPRWHTIEGPCYFFEDGYHYLMYSGGSYMDESYHIGYSVAKSDETDLKKLDFIKHTDNGKFSPLLIKNDFEEGTGHHSVIKLNDKYYAIYHARDFGAGTFDRTGRVCNLKVNKGVLEIDAKENSID